MGEDFETKEVNENQQQIKTGKDFKVTFLYIVAILSIISIILSATLGFFVLKMNKDVVEINNLKNEVASAKNSITKAENDITKMQSDLQLQITLLKTTIPSNSVDLTEQGFQNIQGDFAVKISSIEKYLAGVNVKGCILNLNSCTFNNAKFSITTGLTGTGPGLNITGMLVPKDFTIPKISPGYAANFTVYLPNIDEKDVKYATITYKEASISYYQQ